MKPAQMNDDISSKTRRTLHNAAKPNLEWTIAEKKSHLMMHTERFVCGKNVMENSSLMEVFEDTV